jgi:hypothetical protein
MTRSYFRTGGPDEETARSDIRDDPSPAGPRFTPAAWSSPRARPAPTSSRPQPASGATGGNPTPLGRLPCARLRGSSPDQPLPNARFAACGPYWPACHSRPPASSHVLIPSTPFRHIAGRIQERTEIRAGTVRPRVFDVIKHTMGTSRPHPGSWIRPGPMDCGSIAWPIWRTARSIHLASGAIRRCSVGASASRRRGRPGSLRRTC